MGKKKSAIRRGGALVSAFVASLWISGAVAQEGAFERTGTIDLFAFSIAFTGDGAEALIAQNSSLSLAPVERGGDGSFALGELTPVATSGSVTGTSGATISADGLEIVYVTGNRLTLARRASREAPFETVRVLEELAGPEQVLSPELTPDGLRLVYSAGPAGGQTLRVAARPDRESEFGPPTTLDINQESSIENRWLTFSSDGRRAFRRAAGAVVVHDVDPVTFSFSEFRPIPGAAGLAANSFVVTGGRVTPDWPASQSALVYSELAGGFNVRVVVETWFPSGSTVSDLTCAPSACGGVELSWQNPESNAPSTLVIERDGEEIADLDPGATSYVDDVASVGAHAYEVRASYADEVVTLACEYEQLLNRCGPGIADFACEILPCGWVRMSWSVPDGRLSERILISRDGEFLGSPETTTLSFVDRTATPGTRRYVGSILDQTVTCTLEVPVAVSCSETLELTCTPGADCSVALDWINRNGASWGPITVSRDGATIATLDADARALLDEDVSPGSRVYRVAVEAGGLTPFAVTCEVEVSPCDGDALRFVRGDPNDDRQLDVSDAIVVLAWLFSGGVTPGCLASANINGDSGIDLSDAVYGLAFLFLGGPAPPAPFPACGPSGVAADAEIGCEIIPSACAN